MVLNVDEEFVIWIEKAKDKEDRKAREEIVNKIEKSWDNEKIEVRLTGLSLNESPSVMLLYPHLEDLRLYSNNLTKFPNDLE